ncbi:amino acid synthesis family protein [Micrococcoides hystricis]|uniref:Amino acid synthesis family protein n=1 Tax=Micrococcoides hystricis TaxID=1572761 RepID=A0ABV6PCA7_9MICC
MSDDPLRPKTNLYDSDTRYNYERIAHQIGVRKIVTIVDETFIEGKTGLHTPVKQAAVSIVLKNPWVGGTSAQDLQPETERIAPIIAKIAVDRLIAHLGSVQEIEAFGKAAIVGLDGEIEHAGALIHTPFFGNIVRELLEGSSIMCFSDQRSAPGTQIRIPMWHKSAAATRSYYQSMSVEIADSPQRDELVIIVASSNGPRPNHRIGDRTTDQPVTKELLKGIEL